MIPPDLPPTPELATPSIIRPADQTLLRPGAFAPVSAAEGRTMVADLVRTGRLTPAEARQAMLFVPIVGWPRLGPIELTLDGSFDTGGSSGIHNCGVRTSSGPDTILVVTSRDSNASHATLLGGTWGGNSITVLASCDFDVTHVAVAHVTGPQDGLLSLSFFIDADNAYVTILSIANLRSSSPVSIDTSSLPNGASQTVSLSALGSPGPGGVRIVGGLGSDVSLPLDSWINATGLVDAGAGNYRHFVGYDLGDNASTITMDINHTGGHKLLAGVSLR